MMSLRGLFLKALTVTYKNSVDEKKSWAAAMIVEMETIDSNIEAINFALGCLLAINMETLKQKTFEPIFRWVLTAAILAWASGKIYLLIRFGLNTTLTNAVQTSNWIYPILTVAGVAYAGTAFALARKRYIGFSAFLVTALIANISMFGLTQLQFLTTEKNASGVLLWYFAVVSEEFFMWIIVLCSATFIACLNKFDLLKSTKVLS